VKFVMYVIIAFVVTLISPVITAQDAKTPAEPVDSPPPDIRAPESEGVDANAVPEDSNREQRLESVQTTMVLKVINADTARNHIKKSATSLGGYATHLNDTSITLKIPPNKLTEAIALFAAQGIVIQKTIERQDLTMEIAQLEGKLTSQMEILTKLRGFFDGSDLAATLDIERSMARLVNEIESVKGRLRYLKEQARWSLLVIHFNFHERDKVLYVASPFEWLNSANLESFLEEF
jgi:hypothetical protein